MDNILLIDIGNTAVKWLFDGDYQSIPVAEFNIEILPKAKQIFVSCVGDKTLLSGLKNTTFLCGKFVVF